MPYHPVELVGVVAQLARQIGAVQAEISGLRADLNRFGIGQATDDDSALVAAIHAALGDETFLAAGLLARSLQLDAIGARLAALLAGRSVRGVGKLLAASAGKPTDGGLTLRRVGADRVGAAWQIGMHL